MYSICKRCFVFYCELLYGVITLDCVHRNMNEHNWSGLGDRNRWWDFQILGFSMANCDWLVFDYTNGEKRESNLPQKKTKFMCMLYVPWVLWSPRTNSGSKLFIYTLVKGIEIYEHLRSLHNIYIGSKTWSQVRT